MIDIRWLEIDEENPMSVASCLPLEMQSAEWRQRVELAACYRLLAHYKMTDLIYTHATVRVPGEPGHFLINPYGRAGRRSPLRRW